MIVELGGLDQRVDGSGAVTAGVRTCEEPVLGTELEGPDGALGSVVGDVQSPSSR